MWLSTLVGKTKKSNLDKIQTFQNNVLCKVTS